MGGHSRTARALTAARGSAVALALAALLASAASGAKPGAVRDDARPNVVVIMTDDQTLESLRVMASVNALLAAEGTTFANFFATFPFCCPSRATLLTGQYSHNHGVVGNNLVNGLRNLDERNALPVWLQRAGYATVFVGKYLNGYGLSSPKRVPPGWSEWYGGLRMSYVDHTMNRNGKIVRYAKQYQTDVYRKTAVAAIRRHARAPRPFFLWLSFFAPHLGGPRDADDPLWPRTASPAPRHRDAFAGERLPMPPSVTEADLSDKPAAMRNRPPLYEPNFAVIREAYQQRLESLLAVDEAVAAVVEALRTGGVLDETVILFTSDNGFFHGEHRVPAGKELVYEPSIRVPLIVRGPGVPRGLRLTQPAANVDLAPTIADIADAQPGKLMDGRSLLPLFADPAVEWGRDVLIERGPGETGVGPRLVTALRTPRYLYAEHATGELELYDLERDPHQLESRHADERYRGAREELARRLAVLRDCAGATCAQAPALELTIDAAEACAVVARVGGADEGPPFEQAVRLEPGQTTLRALAVLSDGRRLTLDASVACPA